MPPMRTHTKSRKGCRTCKKRKVKCDETGYPKCRNCTKREIECDWPNGESTVTTKASSSSSLASSSSNNAAAIGTVDPDSPNEESTIDRLAEHGPGGGGVGTTANSTSRRRKSGSPAPRTREGYYYSYEGGRRPQETGVHPHPKATPMPTTSAALHCFDMSSMELLHHYTSQTYLTLVEGRPAMNEQQAGILIHAYQTLIPRFAFVHPFLMHSLLSFSALHVHCLNRRRMMMAAAATASNLSSSFSTSTSSAPASDKDYYGLATYHAEQSNRKKFDHACPPNSCSGDDSTCGQVLSARFLKHVLDSVYSFQSEFSQPRLLSSSQQEQASGPIGAVIEWIANQQLSIGVFFQLHRDLLFNGPLGPLLQLSVAFWTRWGKHNPPISPFTPFAPCLLNIHIPLSGLPDDSELEEPGVGDIYKQAVLSLRIAYQHAFEFGSRLRGMFHWASTVPPRFLDFLRERRPRALVILAHFCLLYCSSFDNSNAPTNDSNHGSPTDSVGGGGGGLNVYDTEDLRWWVAGKESHIEIIKELVGGGDADWVRYLEMTIVEGRAVPHEYPSQHHHQHCQALVIQRPHQPQHGFTSHAASHQQQLPQQLPNTQTHPYSSQPQNYNHTLQNQYQPPPSTTSPSPVVWPASLTLFNMAAAAVPSGM